MPTDEIIIRLLTIVDETLGLVKKHPKAILHRSEVITIGLLFALNGGSYRANYRWLKANYCWLFGRLPEQSRLYRLLRDASRETDRFLAEPTVLHIIDTIGIELIHPRCAGRTEHPFARKGISNHRWIVVVKLGWLINQRGEVVEWQWLPANRPDQEFRAILDWHPDLPCTFADHGFRVRKGTPTRQTVHICERGEWNDRMLIETVFSFLECQFRAKKMQYRNASYLDMRCGYLAALFNCLLKIIGGTLSFLDFVV